MADITISDLELAPALADDMVLPVENTTDTYAATLAMLRRLINKTFVEVENADLNTLTDDGFYQCTGTPTNSPVAGAINWTLQVSAENGVVVQRAFSLDDNFANLYIRRWNGVTWTGWLEVGAGALDNKANVSNTVTTDTAQTISVGKVFTAEQTRKSTVIDITIKPEKYTSNNAFRFSDKNNIILGWIENAQMASGRITTGIHARNKDGYQPHVSVFVPLSGQTGAYALAPTPPTVSAGEEIVTAGWFRESGCNVRTVIETYVNGTEWYRIWSDGWIEQGGFSPVGSYIVNFLKPFTNANYIALCTFQDGYSTNAVSVNSRTNTSLILNRGTAATDIGNKAWRACGY